MTVTKPIFKKRILTRQRFVNNSYTEPHEDPITGLVADTVLLKQEQTDGITRSPHNAF
jgi:hypothetical protein